SPVLWAEIGECRLIGLELVQEMTDKVVLIKEKLKAVRDHQKSYADNRRKPLEFKVWDQVLLKVSPWKGVIRFGKKGKLAPRYIGSFEILENIRPMAYRLRLPEELSSVHNTFYVSNLKKCLADANLHVPLDEIKIDKTLRFVEEPVEILDREVKGLKRSKIPIVKVRWNSKRGPEFTWEHEDHMKAKYPRLFVDCVVEPTILFRPTGYSISEDLEEDPIEEEPLEEPNEEGGSRGSFEVGVGAAEEGRVVCLVFQIAKPLASMTQKNRKYEWGSEIRYHLRKANVVADALSRKERVKPRRVRAMSMTISQVLWTSILFLQVRHPRLYVILDIIPSLGHDGLAKF
ncbi:hypothetical protein Tco_1060087, partial [Tanacetum coccineum]